MKSNKAHVYRPKHNDPYRYERYRLLTTVAGVLAVVLSGCAILNPFAKLLLDGLFKH